jgi:hypothetical protein
MWCSVTFKDDLESVLADRMRPLNLDLTQPSVQSQLPPRAKSSNPTSTYVSFNWTQALHIRSLCLTNCRCLMTNNLSWGYLGWCSMGFDELRNSAVTQETVIYTGSGPQNWVKVFTSCWCETLCWIVFVWLYVMTYRSREPYPPLYTSGGKSPSRLQCKSLIEL